MNNLRLIEKHPDQLSYPPMLPMELAMKTGAPAEICESYGLSTDAWDELSAHPAFQAACIEAEKIVKEEGGSFKMKARAMADSLLGNAWDLINDKDSDPTPPAVKADLIKSVIRFAGLDASIEQKGAAAGKAVGNALQINIVLP